MKDLSSVEDRDTLKYVVRHELKTFGIKVPKEKRSSVRCTQAQGKEKSTTASRSAVFGCSLDEVPAIPINASPGSAVPKFLVDCVQFLQDNIGCEGLFRKPGSRSRQKDLQLMIENNSPIPRDANVHDVAGLFKLFFRELPEPLISGKLAEALLKSRQLHDPQVSRYTTQLLCLTLPPLHCHTLCYALQFLQRVAADAASNRMDAANLALVMTPNLVGGLKMEKGGGSSSTASTEKLLRSHTAVVRHLIQTANDIGKVPDAVVERVESFGNRSGDLLTDRLTSEDELDKSGDGMLEERKKNRRRRRSGPIQGIMSGIGQSLGILKSGTGSAVMKSPATDDVIENPSFLGETPRILRSSKRKASEDLGAFSSAKRKAMLHQMTVDPQYSKPGLSLHREGRQGMTVTDSPITPLRPIGPALGEVDAITEDGSTVFKFQTPSIKFADDSFTTFCATPQGKVGLAGATHGKKLGKLNPLSSKKYKRRSGAIQTDASTPKSVYASYTPKSSGVYKSIKKRLGHRHTRTQPTPIHLNDMPDKSVGWRLANPPMQEDSAMLDSLALGTSPQLRGTPLTRRRQRRQKMPSSPATLFSPCTAASCPVPDQRDRDQGSAGATDERPGAGVMRDTESPKVVVVDLKSSTCPETLGDVSNAYPLIGTDDSNGQELPKNVSSTDVKEYSSGIIKKEIHRIMSPGVHTAGEEPRRPDPSPKHEPHSEATEGHTLLQPSASQKSLSSVLSQVSMDSAKSVFSVEIDYDRASSRAVTEDHDITVQTDETLRGTQEHAELECDFQESDTQICAPYNVLEDADYGILQMDGGSSKYDNDEIDGIQDFQEHEEGRAQVGSVLSLDSAINTEGDNESTGSSESLKCTETLATSETESGRGLVKSVSVDSGTGLSQDNLASFDEAKLQEALVKRMASERGIKSARDIPQGLVKQMSERLSPVEDASEESSCSVSSEDNPQFRETKAFWKLARTGHIFNKSLSDSQVNSPARRAGPAPSPCARSYHSQVHIARRDAFRLTAKQKGHALLNSSTVRSNIDMFNSMCQQISLEQNLRSKTKHPGSQAAENSGSTRALAVPTESATTKPASTRVQPKTNLVKSVSIDSGMCSLGSDLGVPETHTCMMSESHDHDDSHEMAVCLDASMEAPRGPQDTTDDAHKLKPTDGKNGTKYENAEEMPVHHNGDQDIDQIPEHLAPVHALHNEALTPLKLASSTIIRSPGKKAVKIRHRSPLKQLQIPNTRDVTPSFQESRLHKRYPCSPKNPLLRQQASARQERSLIPNHVRDDMDVVEL
ncbi:uncharacterized protein LOC110982869 [Acanthaster planci]|uniref:Uncharacterized protein LOC110982869 n=1 Tax=Acanthaster planci TaxID=133434 RepID=A0A8B7YVF6_ACAPL|nr:uncharacterized protein LOC110982869 [Acanthaster planci]